MSLKKIFFWIGHHGDAKGVIDAAAVASLIELLGGDGDALVTHNIGNFVFGEFALLVLDGLVRETIQDARAFRDAVFPGEGGLVHGAISFAEVCPAVA